MTDEIDALDAELDAIVHRAKKAKHAKPARAHDPLDDLWEEARATPIKPQVWRPVASVCLLNVQECRTCGQSGSWFVGWFTEYLHATDRSARDLRAGRTQELPARVERHSLARTDWCPACAESQLAIEGLITGSGT